jgi:hypothetical protein
LDRINEIFWGADLKLFHYESYLFSEDHRNESTPFEYHKYLPSPLSLIDINVKNNFLINTDFIMSTIIIFFIIIFLFYFFYLTFILGKFLYTKFKKKKPVSIIESKVENSESSSSEDEDDETKSDSENKKSKHKFSVLGLLINKFLLGFLDKSLFAICIYVIMQVNAQKIDNKLYTVSFVMSIVVMGVYGLFVVFQWFVSFWAIDLLNVNMFRVKKGNYEVNVSDDEIIINGGVPLSEASEEDTLKYQKINKIKKKIAGLFTTLYYDLFVGKIFVIFKNKFMLFFKFFLNFIFFKKHEK